MSSLSVLEKRKLEDLLGMSAGYVLDFTDKTFSEFFRTACRINIDDNKYQINGTSKAKRLRAFWELDSDSIVGNALNEMLQSWQFLQTRGEKNADTPLFRDCASIVARLKGEGTKSKSVTVDDFLRVKFEKNSFTSLAIEPAIVPLLELRLDEAMRCRDSKSYLASIFLCGSLLEGLILGAATKNPKIFNQATSSPKNGEGKVKQFHDWKLAEFIDVAHEIGILTLDVKKFSHVLRDFRNFIHPYSQMASGFNPDEHTADICLQVIRAVIASLMRKDVERS